MNQVFNFRRAGYLARKTAIGDWRGIAIASGAVTGSMFVIVLLQAVFEGRRTLDYSSFLIGTLVIWGCIGASLAFTALHDKTRNEAYLLLPASSLEKTVVQLLYVSAALPLLITIVITAGSVITEGVALLLFRTSFEPLNPFQAVHFKAFGYLVIAQSVFFLGAAWFRKAHLVKTVLTLIIFSIAAGFLAAIVFRILFASYFEGFFMPRMAEFDLEPLIRYRFPILIDVLSVTGKVVFYGLLAPFCWVTAWMRVREAQSSDGV